MFKKQVEKSHYSFDNYMNKPRWVSVWHQLAEVHALLPKRVLEIGPGAGVFKEVSKIYGVNVETLDLDEELNPDYVGSAINIPLPDDTFDVVCAFQILEHLIYEDSLKAFSEMVRVSKRNLVLSLPDDKPVWRYTAYIPKIGFIDKMINKPFFKIRTHTFDGEHYWELNKKNYELEKVINDLSLHADLVKTYRVNENPYHRFFIFKKFQVD